MDFIDSPMTVSWVHQAGNANSFMWSFFVKRVIAGYLLRFCLPWIHPIWYIYHVVIVLDASIDFFLVNLKGLDLNLRGRQWLNQKDSSCLDFGFLDSYVDFRNYFWKEREKRLASDSTQLSLELCQALSTSAHKAGEHCASCYSFGALY